MTTNADLLHLPVLPIDWNNGAIQIAAITTEGGSTSPYGRRRPGTPLSQFVYPRGLGRDYGIQTIEQRIDYQSMSVNDLFEHDRNIEHLENTVEGLYNGAEISLQVRGEKEEFYALHPEQLNEIPGALVDAALFLDPDTTSSYQILPRVAHKAYRGLEQAGREIHEGHDALSVLLPFFALYGFPRDGKREDEPRSGLGRKHSPGVVLSTARYQALLAFVCSQLWSHIERKDYNAISSMAYISEIDGQKLLSFLHPRDIDPIMESDATSDIRMNLIYPVPIPRMPKLHQIKIRYEPQNMDSIWGKHARDWLYTVAERQITSLFVKCVPARGGSFKIGVKPGGLLTAMWLDFAERIYRSENPHEGMRQCKQGGKFHGCGEWYFSDGHEDRSHYCPACRAKAGAERVARLRSKRRAFEQIP